LFEQMRIDRLLMEADLVLAPAPMPEVVFHEHPDWWEIDEDAS
jgi:hypothetical protein